MNEGERIAQTILRNGEAILDKATKEKRPLLPDEVEKVKVSAFLRKIAPYLVEEK